MELGLAEAGENILELQVKYIHHKVSLSPANGISSNMGRKEASKKNIISTSILPDYFPLALQIHKSTTHLFYSNAF